MDEIQLDFSATLEPSVLDCPACGKEMIEGHSECYSCGVVVDRYNARVEQEGIKAKIAGIDHLTPIDLKKLDKKWKQVVVNYHDQLGHQDFLKFCQQNSALPFAIFHYSKMLEIDKEDDIAIMMRRQAMSRLSVGTEVVSIEEPEDFNRLEILIRWANWLGLLFGLVCILIGLVNPGTQNLVGLGVAALTLFTALFLYRRK